MHIAIGNDWNQSWIAPPFGLYDLAKLLHESIDK